MVPKNLLARAAIAFTLLSPLPRSVPQPFKLTNARPEPWPWPPKLKPLTVKTDFTALPSSFRKWSRS